MSTFMDRGTRLQKDTVLQRIAEFFEDTASDISQARLAGETSFETNVNSRWSKKVQMFADHFAAGRSLSVKMCDACGTHPAREGDYTCSDECYASMSI